MLNATGSLTIAAIASSLPQALEFGREAAREAHFPEERVGELDLLIEEIFLNVCSHAYPDGVRGEATLTYCVPEKGELLIEVADQGAEFNPLQAPEPDLTLNLKNRSIGGLGIVLVKTLAPSISYRRDRDWNRLTFSMSASS